MLFSVRSVLLLTVISIASTSSSLPPNFTGNVQLQQNGLCLVKFCDYLGCTLDMGSCNDGSSFWSVSSSGALDISVYDCPGCSRPSLVAGGNELTGWQVNDTGILTVSSYPSPGAMHQVRMCVIAEHHPSLWVLSLCGDGFETKGCKQNSCQGGWSRIAWESCSSSSSSPTHGCENAFDSASGSSFWAAQGSGPYSWIQANFNATPIVAGMTFQQQGLEAKMIKSLTLHFTDGSAQFFTLKPNEDEQYFNVSPVSTSSVRLVVESSYGSGAAAARIIFADDAGKALGPFLNPGAPRLGSISV